MMNERILELYKHAHVPYTAIDPSNNMPYETICFSADKFAELMLNEFTIILQIEFLDCVGSKDKKSEKRIERLLTRVKTHFGVEE